MRYDIFLQALVWHLDDLLTMVGSARPDLQRRLLELLTEARDKPNPAGLGLLVNRVFRAFEGSAAESQVRHLFALAHPTAEVGRVRGPSHPNDTTPAPGGIGSTAGAIHAVGDLIEAIQANDAAPSETPPSQDRHINAWFDDAAAPGARTLLCFNIGQLNADSLVPPNVAAVPDADVGSGLSTDWIVETRDFKLAPGDTDARIAQNSDSWLARFALEVPAQGDSATRRLRISAIQPAAGGRLQVLVFATTNGRRELYRHFDLAIEGERITSRQTLNGGPIEDLNLKTTHEWTTPPERLTVSVMSLCAKAVVNGNLRGEEIDGAIVDWTSQPATLAGPIRNVRDGAERFRAKWEGYLNAIDPDELLQRLKRFQPTQDWATLAPRTIEPHRAAWGQASLSPELRTLAIHGHELYESLFPSGSELRGWIDGLAAGSRLDLQWTEAAGAGYVPNVPWGLLYLPEPPEPGQPVDAMGFAALRLRLAYRGYRGAAKGARALAAAGPARQAYCLYWGEQPGDDTGVESVRQRGHFAGWPDGVLVPSSRGTASGRAELLRFFNGPVPDRAALIYLYCRASIGDGERPVLQFGGGTAAGDTLSTTDLLGRPYLADEPLIFANACTTSAADPYVANLLEQNLFRRGCRSYIGTETKVPIQFASRFATVFFEFFNRRIDPKPMAVGEALAQTRLFLFSEYANIGGLFYSLINQYDLYLADASEMRALRAA